jgi:ADP-heptose:LPS heptosyltransferase
MSNIYLPIRAFGDFTITTAVVKNHFDDKLPIILPAYLKDLYNILDASECYTIVDELALERSPAFFELHKVKTPADMMRLVKEVLFINKHLNHRDNYLFDYSNKRLNIFFKHFLYPAKEGNIYSAKIALLEKFLPKKEVKPDIKTSELKSVIFFPGSRKASKVIVPALVDAIIHSGLFGNIELAYHQSEDPPQGAIVFNDFKKLKELVISHDMVISADSLPVHMAYYFNVPHFCIYNDHLNLPWLTPYIEEREYHTVYTGNLQSTVNDIKQKLAR